MSGGRWSDETAGSRLGEELRRMGVAPDQPLVVACSGGWDSVTMLHLLRFDGAHDPAALVVAHFDHGMRAESASDALWVRGLCRAWGLTLHLGRADGRLRGETEARHARWTFLEAVAEQVDAVGVATAHHADDRAETLLHNAVRGTGPRGLSGMVARRGGRLKPLLSVRRAELRRWARARGIEARWDHTNLEPSNPRNRLRLEAIPLLEAIRPGAVAGLLRTARLAEVGEEALTEAEDVLLERLAVERRSTRITLRIEALASVGPALGARLLRRLCHQLGARLDEAGTRAAMEFTTASSGAAEARIPGGVVLRRSLGVLEIEASGEVSGDDQAVEIARGTRGRAHAVVGGEGWCVSWGGSGGDAGWSAHLSVEPEAFPLTVRGWRAGDRVVRGRRSVSLARLWAEQRIPRHDRSRRPVVEDRTGRLVWVPGSVPPLSSDHPGARPLFMEIAHVDNR